MHIHCGACRVIRVPAHRQTHTEANLDAETHTWTQTHKHSRRCGAVEATHYLSLSVKEEEVLCSVCLLSSEARERGRARERGGPTPRESGGGCWEQLRS